MQVTKELVQSYIKEQVTISASGCWEWSDKNAFKGPYDLTSPHVITYRSFIRPDILEGTFVCRSCHNPICVNPEHLYIGPDPDSKLLKRKAEPPKYRYRSTSLNPRLGVQSKKSMCSSLTEDQVCDIYKLCQEGLTANAILTRLNIEGRTVETVYTIKRGQTWKHLNLEKRFGPMPSKKTKCAFTNKEKKLSIY